MNRLRTALRSVRREAAKGDGYAASWFVRRFYYRVVKRLLDQRMLNVEAGLASKLSVVVPAAEKDVAVLPHCLRSIREMIRHELAEIWVVAPDSSAIRAVAEAESCRFVHENTILPRPAAELKCRGWILQQMIKFNAAKYVSTADYLVVDSDTVFLRPQVFIRGAKSVLRYSDQYELLYNRSLALIFGHQRRFPVSFVAHHMLFNVALVQELLQQIECRFGRSWWEVILQDIDRGHSISLSEYDTYGNFVVSRPDWRKNFTLEYWAGIDGDGRDLKRLVAELAKEENQRMNSISFHLHTQ